MANYGSLPFAEALDFFRQKLNLPTAKWDDLLGAAHDRAFVVAGATMADLLADLNAAVLKGQAQGLTLATFKKDFEKIVAERGWTGWTGEGSKGGRAWRARVIYETNLYTSYAAGRFQQMKEVANSRPYWRYRHSDAVTTPRPEHAAWDGKILRHDDPWWAAHAPPNGFGCKCYVETLAARDLKKLGIEPPKAGAGEKMPFNGTVKHINKKTGEVIELPEGVDKGWDYQPGANTDGGRAKQGQQAMNKAISLPPPLAAQAVRAYLDNPAVLAAVTRDFQVWANGWLQELDAASAATAAGQKYPIKTTGELRHVGALSENVLAELAKRKITPASAMLSVRDEDVIHTFRSSKTHQLPRAWYERLPERLRQPNAVLLDLSKPKLPAVLLVFDQPGQRKKLVVELNYEVKEGGQKSLTNIVRSGRLATDNELKGFDVLEGAL